MKMGILVIVPVILTYMALTEAKTFAHPNEMPAALEVRGVGVMKDNQILKVQPNLFSIQFNQLYLNTINGSASWFSDMPCDNYKL